MYQNLIDLIWTAPLAGVSDSPFRMMNRMFGAKHLFSEMISSEALWRKHKRTYKLLNIIKDDSPLIVQLFGSKAESFYSAVKEIEHLDYIKEININSGCPVRKVVKSGSGCALMKETALLAEIIKSVRKATNKRVSVKIRSGWDENSINAIECAKIAQNEGVDKVILHPRTASQMFDGKSDWNLIKNLKKSVDIPVIGNGDVWSMNDAKEMLEFTNCDGVMVGRALIGNPWFFRSNDKKTIYPDHLDVIMKHIEFARSFYEEDKTYKLMKKHLIYYARGTDIKGKKKYYEDISKAKNLEEEIDIVRSFFTNT